MKQYISVNKYKNQLYVRELIDNVENRKKVNFNPYIFQRSSSETDYIFARTAPEIPNRPAYFL